MWTDAGRIGYGIKQQAYLGGVNKIHEWTKFGQGIVGTDWSTVFSAGVSPGLYEYLLDPETIGMASTDPDDANEGTGAWFIALYGLNQDKLPCFEIVVLNGQNPVESQHTYYRVFRMINLSPEPHDIQGQLYVGPYSGAWVAGEPTIKLAHINDGYNQTQFAGYTVPNGYNLLIEAIGFSCSTKDAEFGLYLRNQPTTPGEIPLVFANKFPKLLGAGNTFDINIASTPVLLEEGFEFEIRAKSDVSASRVTANLQGTLVKKEYFEKYKGVDYITVDQL